MKRVFAGALAAGAAAIMGGTAASGPAAAECVIIDQTSIDRFRTDAEYRRSVNSRLLRDVRDLRSAAATLAAYGKEEDCQRLAAAIQDLLENPRRADQVYLQDGVAKRPNVDGDRRMAEGSATGSWEERHRSRLQEAQPLHERMGSLRADEIIGTEVLNVRGDDIGQVDDIVLARGDSAGYLVVSSGGLFGIGGNHVAVPFDKFRIAQDRETLYLPMSQEQLEAAPALETEGETAMMDQAWRKRNDAFFQSVDADWSADGGMKPAAGPSRTKDGATRQ